MKKYTPPSYPGEQQDKKNNEIMKAFNDMKAKGMRVEAVQCCNIDGSPSVIPKIKNLGKSNR